MKNLFKIIKFGFIKKNTNNIKKINLSNYNIHLHDVKKKFNMKKNLLYLKYPYVYYYKKNTDNKSNSIKKEKNKTLYNTKILKYQFYISVILIIFLCIILINSRIKKISTEVFSKDLIKNISLSSLYENRINNINTFDDNKIKEKNQSPFTIGIISINKINITYPILSECSSDLLKISPCKFYGVNPNEIGNCVIAGHNYVDNKLFSNLNQLSYNDLISIYDLSGKCISYSIESIYEVDKTNIYPLRECKDKKKITLITCNNIYDTRLIIEAYEI